jgi:hypothetical protein
MAGTVYPVHNCTFKIGTAGRASTTQQMLEISDLESLEISIDGKKVEWDALDQDGWGRTMITGKKMTFSLKGKRSYGDTGNDYISGKMLATGTDCDSKFELTFPNADKLSGNCAIDIKNPSGGETTDVETLEFDICCDGKPTFTAHTT